MLGMFCKLASRHMIAYANSTHDEGQKVEKSGITIELMRMRDFCFVLRDRAKAALDAAIKRTGYPDGASEVSSSHEFMQHQANLAKTSIQQSTESNKKSQEDYVRAFDANFAKPVENINGPIAQANLSLTNCILTHPVISTTEEVQNPSDTSFDDQNSHENHVNFETSMESIISHPVNDSQEFTVQAESGLWNWWDLIEMDFEGNAQMT